MEIMTTSQLHCGPLSIARKLGKSSAETMQGWPSRWKSKSSDRNWLGLPIDTHWHHKAYLKSIGKKMEALKKPQAGSIVLLNFSFFSRHWCLIHSVCENRVIIDMLTGEFRSIAIDKFYELVSPWPNCM